MCSEALIGSNMWGPWDSCPIQKRIADLEEQLREAQSAVETERQQRVIAEKDRDDVKLRFKTALMENAKLKSDLQIQKGISSVVLSHGAYWQYEIDGSCMPYLLRGMTGC